MPGSTLDHTAALQEITLDLTVSTKPSNDLSTIYVSTDAEKEQLDCIATLALKWKDLILHVHTSE